MSPTRILVVEDEPFIRALMVEALAEAGYDVDDTGNSDAAARLLDADGYNVLVTDLHLPGKLNGVELAERTHARETPLPVVFVTARPDLLARLRQAGVPGAMLSKPFAMDELVSTVQRLAEA
jgi:DNA-binding response OmpR family regulator